MSCVDFQFHVFLLGSIDCVILQFSSSIRCFVQRNDARKHKVIFLHRHGLRASNPENVQDFFCAICLHTLRNTDITTLPCGHSFHEDCIIDLARHCRYPDLDRKQYVMDCIRCEEPSDLSAISCLKFIGCSPSPQWFNRVQRHDLRLSIGPLEHQTEFAARCGGPAVVKALARDAAEIALPSFITDEIWRECVSFFKIRLKDMMLQLLISGLPRLSREFHALQLCNTRGFGYIEWAEDVDSIISTSSSRLPISIPAFPSPPGSTTSPSPLEANDRLQLVIIQPVDVDQPLVNGLPSFCKYISDRFHVWPMSSWLHNNIILQAVNNDLDVLPFEPPPQFSSWVSSICRTIRLHGIHVPVFHGNHGDYVPLAVITQVFQLRPIAARVLLYWASRLRNYILNDMPSLPPLPFPEDDDTELQTVLASPTRTIPHLRYIFDSRLV